MSFSSQILVSLVAGIVAGLFFGDAVSPLKVVADGFVRLLQMTVLPYVTISIVSSLGSLSAAEARRLGLRAGAVLLVLWSVAIGFALLMPVAFPRVQSGSFFSSALVEQRPPFDFVGLYIPSNPFHSLANNIVPAVVLFSVVLGVALIGLERKQVLLDVLAVAGQAVSRATRFVVRLTPYGMFAIAAVAAGTLSLEQIARIQVFLVTYVVVAVLVAAWILPGLVTALTPIGYLEILRPTRNAFITAFMAGDLFIVLPSLIEACKELIARHQPDDPHASTLPDVIVPASFNFPHTGKLLSLSFVLFAGWFADALVPLSEYPRLALTGLLTFFGSLNVAVPFLLDQFEIPADTFQLFLTTGVVNQRFGSLLAAQHTVVVGLLGSAALCGLVRFDARRVARYLVVTAVLVAATLGGLKVLFATAMRPHFEGAEIVRAMRPLLPQAPVTVRASLPDTPPEAPTVLGSIRARGFVRVGTLRERPPYAYHDARGQLVGLDVEMAHQLARDLGIGLELVPLETDEMAGALDRGACDIVMAGVVATPLRATQMRFSQPYLDETLAFVVPDHLRGEYDTWDRARARGDVPVGVPNVPYFLSTVRARLPEARLVPLDQSRDLFAEDRPAFEAVVLSGERGAFITLLHPEYSVVVPKPGIVKVPLAYALARNDGAWMTFVNTWIEFKRRDGTLETLTEHWIFGKRAVEPKPRWSIVRDVLGWVD
jgi:Na+/H+-dicarboxylate symporter/ABC-type amino acid transport substrate-binding protein